MEYLVENAIARGVGGDQRPPDTVQSYAMREPESEQTEYRLSDVMLVDGTTTLVKEWAIGIRGVGEQASNGRSRVSRLESPEALVSSPH